MKKTHFLFALAVMLGSVFSVSSASAQTSAIAAGQTPPPRNQGVVAFNGQAPPPVPADKTAGEFYKNIQVLKDIPAADLNNLMWFFGVSLDVPCAHCHVQNLNTMDSDAKQSKLTARKMIQMTRDLNAANFGGKPVVTCNTCHQGSTRPNPIPAQFNKTPEQYATWLKTNPPFLPPGASAPAQPAAPEPSPVESLPTVGTVYANYRKAVGTTPVTSMHFKGEISSMANGFPGPGRTFPLEINVLNPDKVERIGPPLVGPGQARLIINGNRGWNVTPAGTTELPPAQIPVVMQSDVWSPLKHVAQEQGKVTAIEKINDRSYYDVEWSDAKRAYSLYFDTQSGLLYKYREDIVTAFGIVRTETVYEDYGDVGGVKLPRSISKTNPSGYTKFKFSELQINIPMDPKKFDPPPAQPAEPPKQ